jgi:hypothetical protein
MTVLVCGGRDYRDRAAVFRELDAIHAACPIMLLVQGQCPTGADQHAREWAKTRGVRSRGYQADWRAHGRAAGPIRNAEMLADSGARFVVAFPGGRGTIDMVRRAKAAGVPVRKVPP